MIEGSGDRVRNELLSMMNIGGSISGERDVGEDKGSFGVLFELRQLQEPAFTRKGMGS